MKEYLDLVRHVRDNGVQKGDRTGTGTVSVFGYQMRFDLAKGFPLVTTKKTNLSSIIHELLWFLKGDTNIQYLNDNNVKIWDEWAVTQDQVNEFYADIDSREWVPTSDCDGITPVTSVSGLMYRVERPTSLIIADIRKKMDLLESKIPRSVITDEWEIHSSLVRAQNDYLISGPSSAPGQRPTSEYPARPWDASNKDVHLLEVHGINRFYYYDHNDMEIHQPSVGDLGPVYGKQWRSWVCPNRVTVDQIAEVIEQIKRNPNSRRLIVSGWNPSDLPDDKLSPKENAANNKPALPPCHTLFQFYVLNGKLSCQLYQRSADTFLGVPYNIASYALLTMMIAQVCDLELGDFVHTFGDAHLYNNHFEQVDLLLSREPKPLPTMTLNPAIKNINDFKFEDFTLSDYECHPFIKADISV